MKEDERREGEGWGVKEDGGDGGLEGCECCSAHNCRENQ